MNLAGIKVKRENGVFRVPAELKEGFELVPQPTGKLSLAFWDRGRMRKFLRTHGYSPSVVNASK